VSVAIGGGCDACWRWDVLSTIMFYSFSRVAGPASPYVRFMMGATWHDGIDVDAIEGLQI